MKLLFLLLVLFLTFSGYAQSDSLKQRTILVNVSARNQNFNNYYLQGVGDTVISVSKKSVNYGAALQPTTDISYRDINVITYRRKGAAGRSLLLGAGIGVLTGVAIGFASGDDPPSNWFSLTAGDKALVGGLLLGVTGTVVGAIVGLISTKRFTIARDPDNFRLFRQFVQRKTQRVHSLNY
jgi:hypothetical protein